MFDFNLSYILETIRLPYASERSIFLLSKLPSEVISISTLVISFCFLIFAFHKWKLSGLLVYLSLSVVIANIQVFKGANFCFSREPIALGNIAYGTVSVVIAIITELYGYKISKKILTMAFFSSTYVAIAMLLAISHKPIEVSGISKEIMYLQANHFHMYSIFSKLPNFVISSITAYYISSYFEIALIALSKKICKNKFASARIFIINSLSSFIDIVIMSYIAWVLTAENNIGLKSLFSIYIIGSYPFRFAVSLFSVPVVSIARKIYYKNNSSNCDNINGDESLFDDV